MFKVKHYISEEYRAFNKEILQGPMSNAEESDDEYLN